MPTFANGDGRPVRANGRWLAESETPGATQKQFAEVNSDLAHPLHSMNKIKPFLITAVVAIVAVWAFNKFIGPRVGVSA